jgi:hypothetical protein
VAEVAGINRIKIFHGQQEDKNVNDVLIASVSKGIRKQQRRETWI